MKKENILILVTLINTIVTTAILIINLWLIF